MFKLSVIILSLLIFYISSAENEPTSASQAVTTATSQSSIIKTPDPVNKETCVEPPRKNFLVAGWYLWEPYQFNRPSAGGFELVGMDVTLVKAFVRLLGMDVKYEEVPWKQHQLDLKAGTRDIAAGATYTDDRAKYAYFSIPYRYEENSLFTLQKPKKELNFSNIKEFLAQMRLQNYKLGIIKGFTYASPEINAFISDQANEDIIISSENTTSNLQALIRGSIDGFLADRVVGAAAILTNQLTNRADPIVMEVPLHIKTSIHLMFSKKTISIDVVEKFNTLIANFVETDRYKTIVSYYLYPVLLQQTMNSEWFYIVSIIGTIAFAFSGVAIAAKENSTLFGTFIFAMLPSVGGGIMRDVILNRDKIGILLNPAYMYYIVIIVLVGFATIRLLNKYNQNADEDSMVGKFWNNLLTICDAVGQAAFIITGVTIAIMGRISPIELWGPFFAFLTANGGGILRDLIRKDRIVGCISGEINAEVSVLWGFIFAMFLSYSAFNPDLDRIRYAVIIVILGAFLTRMVAHYMKIPNLKFRND